MECKQMVHSTYIADNFGISNILLAVSAAYLMWKFKGSVFEK